MAGNDTNDQNNPSTDQNKTSQEETTVSEEKNKDAVPPKPSIEDFEELFQFMQTAEEEDKFSSTDVVRAKEQEVDFDQELRKTQLDHVKSELEHSKSKVARFKEDTDHRRSLIVWAAMVVSVWLLFVVYILTRNTNEYRLSDPVLLMLLGTTTVNVLGLMIIVMSDIFRKNEKEPDK